MEGYVYLGEMFDFMGRTIGLTDKKIGRSEDCLQRENDLSRTKSPIGYRIITAFKVDDMFKVERMLHSILDSKRTYGEWFRDDDDTLTSEFLNFMLSYGGEQYDIDVEREKKKVETDVRLIELANTFNCDVELVRTYMGVDYDVTLLKDGLLVFNGEIFDTPNKLYNNGIVKFVKGVKGNSGTNSLSQFKIKKTGERLKD
jgi:hypothetical protein